MTRVAVIGAGAMGRNHVRVYRELANVDLVAVADTDTSRTDQLAALYGVSAYADYRRLLEVERPDAVTVAVPTQAHAEIVLAAFGAGCHVIVEKPIAGTVVEAEQIVSAAAAAQRTLMVGHIERFNPAIRDLKRRLDENQLGRVFQIHARRLGPFPSRVRDVGVVIDLATHDLDIMRYLTGSEALRVYAETRREVHTSGEDLFNGMVRFDDETLGLLEINWLTPTKIRELYVTGERGMFRADYLTQDLYLYENAHESSLTWSALSVLRGVSEGAMTRFAVPKVEPLRAELEAFVEAVNGGESHVVTGRDGLLALQLAIAMIESGLTHQAVEFAYV